MAIIYGQVRRYKENEREKKKGEKKKKTARSILVNRGSRVSNTCYEARGVTPADYITLALSTAEQSFPPRNRREVDRSEPCPRPRIFLPWTGRGHYPADVLQESPRLRCVLHVRSIISSWKVRKPRSRSCSRIDNTRVELFCQARTAARVVVRRRFARRVRRNVDILVETTWILAAVHRFSNFNSF